MKLICMYMSVIGEAIYSLRGLREMKTERMRERERERVKVSEEGALCVFWVATTRLLIFK